MNDHHHIPEVDEYRSNPWGMSGTKRDGVGYGGYVAFTPKVLADAAIAALEVLVAKLESDRNEWKAIAFERIERCDKAEDRTP